MATALCVAGCRQKKRVRFTTAAGLINELVEAQHDNQLRRSLARQFRYELIAIDEVGYVPLADLCLWRPRRRVISRRSASRKRASRSRRGRETAAANLRNSDHLAVESRGDLASCHGSIGRIALAHSWSYRSDNPICTRTHENTLLHWGGLARSLRGRRKAALHIDAKRCIPTTYCGPNGLKTFCRADS